MGLAARRGPKGCQMPPPYQKKSGGRETIPDYSPLCTSFRGSCFLSKVSLCVLTDTQEPSQPRSSLALLRNRSGEEGEGRVQG